MRNNLLSEEVLQFFEVKRIIQKLTRDLYEQQNIWNGLYELVVSLIEGITHHYRWGAAIPFSEKVRLQFFNTLKPTKGMAKALFEQGTIWEALPTGTNTTQYFIKTKNQTKLFLQDFYATK